MRDWLSRWFGVALVGCILVTGIGGVLAYEAHADPGTSETTLTVTDGRIHGEFTHRARINERAADTPFEPNTVVADRSLYFERVMPVLEGSFVLSYTEGDEPVEVTVRRAVAVESVGSGEGDETVVYWRQNRSETTVERTVDPGGDLAVPFAVNVSEALADGTMIGERIGSSGKLRIRIVATVVATKTGAQDRSVSRPYTLTIESDSGVYRPSGESGSEPFSRTVTEEVRKDPGPMRAIGGPVLFVVGILGAGGLGVLSVREDVPVSQSERAWLAYSGDRTDFEEWIHTVTLPDDVVDDPTGEAATLGDLVDFAIDADEAVVKDPGRGAYFVVHEGWTFAYYPPEPPTAVGGQANGENSGEIDGGDTDEEGDGPLSDPEDDTRAE